MAPEIAQHPSGRYAVPDVPAYLDACDTVELKAVLAESEGSRAAHSLGFDLAGVLTRQVYYLDTPGLALEAAGVIVRVRRTGDAGADTTVRIRPADPAALEPELRRRKGFNVELDMGPDGFVCSASLKTRLAGATVVAAATGRASPGALFTPRQRRLFQAYAPVGMALDGLCLFGPVRVQRLAGTARGWQHPLTVQMWEFPAEPVVELSSKVAAADAAAAVARWPSFLDLHRVIPRLFRHTKAQTALRASAPRPAFG
ncbi:hypothetical protein Cme02nite_04380 [Catellatospora methionotrophica]|uniref:CYTH domain-containing protein n=1 Tax=Catellatospora methionotrophica TaxID=121620 RepID=A0A8J3PC64_9ACTN|nr:hypothetical protein [Catellatospora methionotrophica]GIG12106.1 hypothetical protein Cme02nite_04380 [Catellatospora methionotrophica]